MDLSNLERDIYSDFLVISSFHYRYKIYHPQMEEVSYVTTDTTKLTEGGESLGESEMGNEIPEEGP